MQSKEVVAVAYAETSFTRPRKERGDVFRTPKEYLAEVVSHILESTEMEKSDLDHQGLCVAGSGFPHANIYTGEVAQDLGLRPRWVDRADHGGMDAISLIVNASLAIQAGIIDLALCVGADSPFFESFRQEPRSTMNPREYYVEQEWRREYTNPFGMMGPNSLFAFVKRRYMHQYGASETSFGKVAVSQRTNASRNPNAYLKTELSIEDYLNSKMIADPIRVLDCCIAVNGGCAILLSTAERAREITDQPVYIKGYGESVNHSWNNSISPDITYTGVVDAAQDAYKRSNLKPESVDFAQIYDDYTVAVIMQLEDIGICPKGEGWRFIEEHDVTYRGDFPVNTSGGLLSAGQPGTSGGFVHVIEAIQQLRGEATGRQIKDASIGLVTGCGGIAYGKNLGNTSVLLLGMSA